MLRVEMCADQVAYRQVRDLPYFVKNNFGVDRAHPGVDHQHSLRPHNDAHIRHERNTLVRYDVDMVGDLHGVAGNHHGRRPAGRPHAAGRDDRCDDERCY